MTIVVAAVSSEGIALASDSRTTQRWGRRHHRIATDSSRKLFVVGGRFGVATYGDAMIGSKTIGSMFDEWVRTIDRDIELRPFAEALGQRFQQALPIARAPGKVVGSWPLGFLVAGYEENSKGQVLEIRVRPEDFRVTDTDAATDRPSLVYRGQTSTIRRLIRGVDFDEIRDSRIHLDERTQGQLSQLHYELIGPTTTQDAVDLAYFLIETTVTMQRFSDGTLGARNRDGIGTVPGCGGPVQAVVVEPQGARWVARQRLTVPARSQDASREPQVRADAN